MLPTAKVICSGHEHPEVDEAPDTDVPIAIAEAATLRHAAAIVDLYNTGPPGGE